MGAQDYEGLVSLYHGIFLYCGIGAILFLAVAILLFILLKIPRVFSELTGRVAKKAIAQMSEDGAASGDLNTSRRIGDDGRRHRRGRTGALGTSKLRRKSGSLSGGLPTEKMAANSGGLGEYSGQMGSPAGDGSAPTDVLSQPQSSFSGQMLQEASSAFNAPGGIAPPEVSETPPTGGWSGTYDPAQSETMVLGGGPGGFVVLRTIMEVHTDEVI